MEEIKPNTTNKKTRVKSILSFLSSITNKKQSENTSLTTSEKRKIKKLMNECLLESGGEVAARERAANIGQIYFGLDKSGRKEILLMLLSFSHNEKKILEEIRNITFDVDENKHIKEENIYKLKNAIRSPRKTILRNFNFLENGISLLVEMREDLLKFIDSGSAELIPLERDFEYLLNSWFDIGFLDLERITWDSSASLLEKVIQYEAVHKIKSWNDLNSRLSSDRRFYAFFHPKFKSIPLIFVEIALMKKVADSVQEILNEERLKEDINEANTAIFYSISNTQNGLRGISFGNFLIKRVVKELQKEFPKLKNFVTLSPIPRFIPWLKEMNKTNKIKDFVLDCFKDKESKDIERVLSNISLAVSSPVDSFKDVDKNFLENTLKPVYEKLITIYLINKDKNWTNDPVLKFHLNNGAYLYRINWMGDTSDNGMKQSLGMMVNYWYSLKDVEKNHEEFMLNNKIYSSIIKKITSMKIEK